MKIGILTYHQSVNNGAVMQAYSLSKRVQAEFPDDEVEIIDYRMRVVDKNYTYTLKSYFKTRSPIVFAKKCVRLLLDPLQVKRLQKRTEIFKSCLPTLPLSKETITDEDSEEIIRYINEHYDVLIVGSDAIWNYISRGFPNVYLPDARIRCKKLSYAASCYGMDFSTRPEEERSRIKDFLNEFSFIGVRDEATEQFVRWSGCEHPVSHTCDPTAFLNVDDLPIDVNALKKKMQDRGFDFSKPAIGIMGNPYMLKMIRSFYKKEYQLVSLYNYLPGADVQLYDLTPYEWAYVFRYFKLLFTTYFHGTMLSLRNGVPLICIALETPFAKKHKPKTLDVLERLGYADWYFKTDYKTINIDQIKRKADELLVGNLRDEIITALNEEATSYEAFGCYLKNVKNKL